MAQVALVIASGFEQAETDAIRRTLVQAGHHVAVVSPKKHAVRGWDNTHWGADLSVDVAAIDAEDGKVITGRHGHDVEAFTGLVAAALN